MINEIKTVKITEKGQIAIPKEIREKIFKIGSKIAIIVYKDYIELRPLDHLNLINQEKEIIEKTHEKEHEKAWRGLF